MLNWGVIGPGGIARVFCNGMRFTEYRANFCRCKPNRIQSRGFCEMFLIFLGVMGVMKHY